MYVYADDLFNILGVPLIVIAYWVVIGHTSWIVYKKFGWIAGLLTGIIINLSFEFLAFDLGGGHRFPAGLLYYSSMLLL